MDGYAGPVWSARSALSFSSWVVAISTRSHIQDYFRDLTLPTRRILAPVTVTMEVVGAASAAVAFFQLLERVIQAAKHIIDTVKDAPHDIQLIHSEIVTLQLVLKQNQDAGTLDTLGLTDENGTLRQCQKALEDLALLLPTNAVFLSSGKRRKTSEVTLTTLTWSFKASKAKKLLAEISQHKATILLGLAGIVA